MDVLKSGMKQAATVASKMWVARRPAHSYSDDEVRVLYVCPLLMLQCLEYFFNI